MDGHKGIMVHIQLIEWAGCTLLREVEKVGTEEGNSNIRSHSLELG